MSLVPKCDLCGKTKSKTKFTPGGIKLQVPNYKKQKLNFKVDITVENPKDTKILEKLKNDIDQLLYLGMLDELDNDIIENGIQEMQVQTYTKLKTPNPMLCDNCKKEIIKLAFSYGSFKKFLNPFET